MAVRGAASEGGHAMTQKSKTYDAMWAKTEADFERALKRSSETFAKIEWNTVEALVNQRLART